ncbi:phosphodiester glycosidase family protein, partial [Oligoflexia bacterium]|nr:phosphodiester glycosidase family protein [Oligoflexia bacterium]
LYLVAVDGARPFSQGIAKSLMIRERSVGMTIFELAKYMHEDLGCECGIEMDGGKSVTMYYENELVNMPATGKEHPLNGPILVTRTH